MRVIFKMQKKLLFTLIVVCLVSTNVSAEENLLDCRFTKYADASGIRKFNSPLKLKIFWDGVSREALMKTSRRSHQLKINEGVDFLSFVQILDAGSVTVTSVSKTNGSSVHSINQFGLSQQAYGICEFSHLGGQK